MILGGKFDDFRGECFIGSGGMDAPAANDKIRNKLKFQSGKKCDILDFGIY